MPKRSDPSFAMDATAVRRGTRARGAMPYALVMHAVRKEWAAGCDGCAARVRVLHGVRLRVRFGEAVGISGPAGAGKTTLLLCAAGLARLDGGRVSRNGGWVRYLPSDPSPARRLAALAGLPPAEGAGWAGRADRPAAGVAECAGGSAGLILLDELPEAGLGAVGELLRRRAAAGDAVLVASRDAGALGCLGVRQLVLADGVLAASLALASGQRRKRTAARSSASSPDSCAASRMRSTCGRRPRSPQ